jgi:hypothetical protein
MKKEMSKKLDQIFKDIKSNKSFEKSSFSKSPSDKIYYDRLVSMYKSL